jgi:CheY-like chemotaxis protein
MTISMLVVDDEETDVIRFKRAARKAGVQRRIEICRGGAEAFGLLAAQTQPSTSDSGYLLVSDLKMPVMRGTELVARLRGELDLAELPAFILSSSDSASDIEEALCSGANGYILKCESEADYLDVVRWLEDCCCLFERGHSLTNETYFSVNRPSQVIVGPVAYRNYV